MKRYMVVSSEKSLTLDLTCSGRSFMYAKKTMVPSTEPSGTPEVTGIVLELVPLVTTDCFLLSKKSLIHLRVSPLMPLVWSFFKKIFRGQLCRKLC